MGPEVVTDTTTGEVAPPPPPPPPPVAGDVESTRCTLCDALLVAESARCPGCGLWLGGRGRQLSARTLLAVAAAFALVYVLTLLVVLSAS